ncbi:DUF4136 domain-containing protein [Pseudomonas stutzeri]|nr:DUF4136 domain-containing protein [Stutzerimonas stutzeri]
MPVRPAVLILCAALAGCQANPYSASRVPYPPPPTDPGTARMLDPGSYPAGTPSFARHRNWQWHAPLDATLAEIVGGELERRGLRPATASNPATLSLLVHQRSVIRQRLVYDDPWLDVGYRRFHRRYGYWAGAPYPPTRSVTYRVVEVELVFFDASGGEPLWRGTGSATLDGRRQADALRQALRRALDGFPPP